MQWLQLEPSVMPDFHWRISLDAGSEILVSENLKNKSNSKFLHLMSEIIVSSDNLPKEVLIEGSEGQHTM